MHNKLIIKAFEKAQFELNNRGILKPSRTAISTVLSDFMEEEIGFSFVEKNFRTSYRLALKDEEVNFSQIKVVEGLCRYLGYKDYVDFVLQTKKKETQEDVICKFKENNQGVVKKENKKGKIIGISIIALLISYLGYDTTKKGCMIWVGTHYEKIRCEEKRENGIINFEKMIFEEFKQVEPDSSYLFFKQNGEVNLWYGKSFKGELEYFTTYGMHPITKKTLKEITPYMIQKHIYLEY